MEIRERVYKYAERKFQASGRTEFPTVRQVAKALGVKQDAVKEAIEDDSYGDLMLTSFHTVKPEPLGSHFVETFERGDN